MMNCSVYVIFSALKVERNVLILAIQKKDFEPTYSIYPFDTLGWVYEAGWGIHERAHRQSGRCVTSRHGPDPFTRCKFPFIFKNKVWNTCIKTQSPTSLSNVCMELYKKKNKTNLLEKGYDRVSRYTAGHVKSYRLVTNKDFGLFYHLPKRIQKQIINHWKEIIQSSQIRRESGRGIILEVATPT